MQELSTATAEALPPIQESVSLDANTYEGPMDPDGLAEARKAKRQAAAQAQAEAEAANAQDEQEEAPEAENTQPESDLGAEEQDLDAQTSEDGEDPEEDNQAEAAEDDEAPQAPIDAPHFWSAEGKQHFASLDPKTQQFVLDQDKHAQAFVTKARMDLATKVETQMREANSERQAKLQQLDATISSLKQKIIQDAATNPDVRVAIAEGSVTSADLEAYANEQLREANAELQRQEQELQQSFLAQRNLELQRMESPLLDPVKAEPFLAWANSKGITPDVVAQTEALHLDLAWKAFQYEQGQNRLKARPKPKPKPPAKPVRPGVKGSGSNNQNARLKELEAKARKTGSFEDVLALKKAKTRAGAA